VWGCYGAVLAVVVFSDCGPAPARRKRLKDQHTQSRPSPPPSNKKQQPTTTRKKKNFSREKAKVPYGTRRVYNLNNHIQSRQKLLIIISPFLDR
jgi:hypothetical protein